MALIYQKVGNEFRPLLVKRGDAILDDKPAWVKNKYDLIQLTKVDLYGLVRGTHIHCRINFNQNKQGIVDKIDRLWDENLELLKERLLPCAVQVPVSFSGDTQMTLDAVPPVEPILEDLKTDKGKEGLVTAEDEGKEEVEEKRIWGGYGGDMGGIWRDMGEDGGRWGKMGEDGGRWGKNGERWEKMGKMEKNGG